MQQTEAQSILAVIHGCTNQDVSKVKRNDFQVRATAFVWILDGKGTTVRGKLEPKLDQRRKNGTESKVFRVAAK